MWETRGPGAPFGVSLFYNKSSYNDLALLQKKGGGSAEEVLRRSNDNERHPPSAIPQNPKTAKRQLVT